MSSVIIIPPTRQVRLTPEEVDLVIHACWTARQQAQLDKYDASEEGDYRRVGEMEAAAERMWELIVKLRQK